MKTTKIPSGLTLQKAAGIDWVDYDNTDGRLEVALAARGRHMTTVEFMSLLADNPDTPYLAGPGLGFLRLHDKAKAAARAAEVATARAALAGRLEERCHKCHRPTQYHHCDHCDG